MAEETQSRIELEIGHVLFIDIVGYSRLLINEQTEALQALNEAVRQSPHFRTAEAERSLIRLPTGDGMALVFLHGLEAPVRCALEITEALRGRVKFALRMGIHSGPVNQMEDVNGALNLTGAGVNIACRVMDCGDAGHILVSRRVAEDLEQYQRWQENLYDLGTITVKHDIEIGIFNLCTADAGNRAIPRKIKHGARRGFRVAAPRGIAAGVVLLCAIAGGLLLWRQGGLTSDRGDIPVNHKSIAVLPFENRSEDKANAYFTEGIQDEILTRLSKIADLKVISRTSTQHYKSAPENLSEIARQLGVAHILEGSVQKAGDSVRINVQLIQAQTDSHIWAEIYDRKLTDVLAVESEVAKAIAEQLSVKLTGSEQTALSLKLTDNTEAYDAYLRGLTFEGHGGFSAESLAQKVKAYQRATQFDPRFAQAWARLSSAHVWLYYQFDRTSQRLASAKQALDNAIRLAPDTGEVLLALGHYRYGTQDFEGARQAYSEAREKLPNNSEVLMRLGGVTRRLGKWEEALVLHTQAAELDPRNTETWTHQAWTLRGLRRFQEALVAFDRALQLAPGDPNLLTEKAITYQMMGDLAAAGKVFDLLPNDPAHQEIVPLRLNQWLYERQYAPALAALRVGLAKRDAFPKTSVAEALSNLAFVEMLNGERDAALHHAAEARDVMEALRAQGDDNPWNIIMFRAQTWTLLGEYSTALAEAQRAVAATANDAFVHPQALTVLARVEAHAGQTDAAIELLGRLLQIPCAYAVTPATLRIEPDWDMLRSDPRFQKLASE
jgi:TolB-like protein/Flp pilus assembly protein TadD/class 3 adenylate cyclase